MIITATVQSIGEKALDAQDPILVLFDQTATPDLQAIAVIQQFDAPLTAINLTAGSQISIDDQEYTVNYAGQLVATNLASIGHATLYFRPVPAKPLENGIYLAPSTFPQVHVGSVIKYQI
ncbi:PTS glucitol/sorbitol transporter subunit IIA [Lactiplantibacillus modestisalitolerans]|uniref:PTS glucitol/sorbitol transporter subunit IIA n=1 Tax=Lactiplantibacillus modestisalitolerans TaxID=1457219 RepID=A0ABV5WTG9_9LACO|nr:PTS glucitol/sorbitol transporter subunit IIA [Lactiplantibacillus modestisalitolerans]